MKAMRGLGCMGGHRARRASPRGGLTLAAVALILAMAGPSTAMEYDDLLFYAPFDDSLAPLIAKGSPVPELGTGKPAFGDGVIGKALIAGSKDESLSYAVKDNLDDRIGTLAVWIKKMTYDATNLYLLVVSDQNATGAGEYVEVWLAADAQAAPDRICRFRVADDDTMRQSQGMDAAWQGAWTAARSAADHMQVVEMALPFATLRVDPQTARDLRLNIIRGWSQAYGDWASWADTTLDTNNEARADRFGLAMLGHQAPVVSLQSLGKPHYATLAVQGHVVNPKAASELIQITARLQPTDLEEWIGPDHGLMVGEKRWSGTVVDTDRAIDAKPGVNVLTIAQDFRDTDINSVLVRAEDAEGTLLYAQQVPFVCTPPILLEARTYPKHGRVDVVADISEYREAAPTELAADIAFLDSAGRSLATSSIPQFRSRTETAPYELGKLPEGEITVRATLRKIDGPALATSESRFTTLAPGPWLNNTLGLDDIVIPPFEPIRVDGTRVSVWNRTYVWDDSLLPVEIHAGGVQILAAPIALYSGENAAGKPTQAVVTVVRHSPTVAVLEAKGEMDGVPVTARSTIEYDGMILTELVFEPQEPATLRRLGLVMPMQTEQAWLYHFHGRGGAVAETENARGPLRGDADVPAQFWLGTPEGGLGFFTVSAENWGPRKEPHVKIDGKTTITVKPDALGIAGRLTATDWWTRHAIPLDGNSVTVEVPGSGWRMIAVEGNKHVRER